MGRSENDKSGNRRFIYLIFIFSEYCRFKNGGGGWLWEVGWDTFNKICFKKTFNFKL